MWGSNINKTQGASVHTVAGSAPCVSTNSAPKHAPGRSSFDMIAYMSTFCRPAKCSMRDKIRVRYSDQRYFLQNWETPCRERPKPSTRTHKTPWKWLHIKVSQGKIRVDQSHKTGLLHALFNVAHKQLVCIRPDRLQTNCIFTPSMFPTLLSSASFRQALLFECSL